MANHPEKCPIITLNSDIFITELAINSIDRMKKNIKSDGIIEKD